jgi:hypothetical protein
MLVTPDGKEPCLTIYFTYGDGHILLQGVVEAP